MNHLRAMRLPDAVNLRRPDLAPRSLLNTVILRYNPGQRS